MFVLKSDYGTAGDQEQAIQELIKQINEGQERCVLMGVTGSGKTFAMANIIERLQIPTLILSHNKTLARQLWQEMSELFPEMLSNISLVIMTTISQKHTFLEETCISIKNYK